MTTLTEKAYAKVNLTLDVLGKRDDRYHDLRSVMQSISLCDTLTLTLGTGKAWALHCTEPGVPCDSRNLVWKAAEVFFDAAGLDPDGLDMELEKNIPSQAGLGGGSADAAAVLRALNRHYGNVYTPEALADLGARVGSDVPFCVLNGTAMAEGRGERLRELKKLTDCWFVVVKPEFPVSTPVLFKKLDSQQILVRPDNAAMEEALAREDLRGICKLLCNVFEPAVAQDHPEIHQIKSMLLEAGAWGCQMSGSGSACFGIVPTEEAAGAVLDALKKVYPKTYLAQAI